MRQSGRELIWHSDLGSSVHLVILADRLGWEKNKGSSGGFSGTRLWDSERWFQMLEK
jgi:hypothetical protein